MRHAAIVLLAALALPAHADTVNVARSTELLDFDLPRGAGGPDIDGDGQISRAEAAGNSELTLGFDRADRNRNGKVSAAEWQRYEKWRERRAKAREARLARARAKEAAAAAGSTAPRKTKPQRNAP